MGTARAHGVARFIGEAGEAFGSLELSAALYYASYFCFQKQTFCVPPVGIKRDKPESDIARGFIIDLDSCPTSQTLRRGSVQ